MRDSLRLRLRPLPSVLAAALLAGCAAMNGTNSGLAMGIAEGAKVAGTAFSSADSVSAEIGAVWQSLAVAYERQGVRGAPIGEGLRVFGTRGLRLARSIDGKPISRYLDCGIGTGGVPRADTHTVTLEATTELVAIDATHTLLRSRVTGSAQQPGGLNSVRCGTTGVFEEELAARVRATVKAGE